MKAIPVSKGRSRLRRCITCKVDKSVRAFGPRRRRCLSCEEGGVHRQYKRTCYVCDTPFIARAKHTKMCSDKCRRTRSAYLARERRLGAF